jgi:hypothetical protein
VCVHRLITDTLLAHGGGRPEFCLAQSKLSEIAETCNTKKEAAKAASMDSDTLFLNVFINSLSEQQSKKGKLMRAQSGKMVAGLRTRAIVQDLGDQSFTLLLPELGVDKRVHAVNEWRCSRVRAVTEQPDALQGGDVGDAAKTGRGDGKSGRGGAKAGHGDAKAGHSDAKTGHGKRGGHGHGHGKESHGGGKRGGDVGQQQRPPASQRQSQSQSRNNNNGDEARSKVKELELIWKLKDNKEKKMTLKVLVAFDVVLAPKQGAPRLDFECHLVD